MRRDAGRLLLAALALAVVVGVVLHAPRAARDFTTAFEHFRFSRLPWVAVAAGAETASLACYALAQRRLLAAAGVAVPLRTLMALTLSSTAVRDLVPGGVVPANGWLLEQYGRRSIRLPVATWAVLANGFTSTVSILALLLVGAAVAGVGGAVELSVSAAVLLAGGTLFVALTHRLHFSQRWLNRHRDEVAGRVVDDIGEAARLRATPRGGAVVFTYCILNWLFDAVCLLVAFELVGLAVPWRAALFGYCAGQVAGAISFLPGGLGAVEGGVVGALVLTGTPASLALAGTLVYRVLAYWLVMAVGVVTFLVISRSGQVGGGR